VRTMTSMNVFRCNGCPKIDMFAKWWDCEAETVTLQAAVDRGQMRMNS